MLIIHTVYSIVAQNNFKLAVICSNKETKNTCEKYKNIKL